MTEFLFFTQPMALFLTMLLPLLWLLLRLLPLRARPVVFPALVLFGKDKKDKPKPQHIPLWLKLLRLAVILFLIMGLARPVYDPGRQALSFDPTLIVIDNSWPAAAGWDQRIEAIESRLNAFADVSQVPVTILTTAPDQNTGRVVFEKNISADEARQLLPTLRPQPWNSDFEAAENLIKPFLFEQDTRWQILWFGDGQKTDGFDSLYDTISNYGDAVLYHDDQMNQGLALTGVSVTSNALDVTFKRFVDGFNYTFTLSALSADGNTILQQDVTFPEGENEYKVSVEIPEDILSEVRQLKTSVPNTAATMWSFAGALGTGHAGIVTERDINQKQDYLNDVFYIHRAVSSVGRVSAGSLDDLLQDENISLLILPDSTKLVADQPDRLREWVSAGNTVLRFAGENLLQQDQPDLLPVDIVSGQRSFGGALTWEQPARIKSFASTSPFSHLSIPQQVTTRKQILARPDIDLNNKTWVFLEDQTPLVTADTLGRGKLVFVHTTADPSWSDLSISDIFPSILKSILDDAAKKQANISENTDISLLKALDAFGREYDAGRYVQDLSYADALERAPSYDVPTGIYQIADNPAARVRLNLGQALKDKMAPTRPYYLFDQIIPYTHKPYVNLAAFCYMLAGILMLAEMIAGFVLINGAARLKPAKFFMIACAFCIMPLDVQAQEVRSVLQSPENVVNFAFIQTGDAARDTISQNGLSVLGTLMRQRTTVEFGQVDAVVPGLDDLSLYPFLYWSMVSSQDGLSEDAVSALQHYINHGGLIFFDTRDAQFQSTDTVLGQETMQRLAGALNFGSLQKLDKDHVLSRSYYLLNSYEGLYTGRPVWVEAASSIDYDGAPSVVVGAHDWAAAWSNIDPTQNIIDLQANSRSREMALRFGVNLVMMALTGSYKTDQVHIQYMLDRMKTDE